MRDTEKFEAGPNREVDANGRLHVRRSHVTKSMVRPYYGFEIPQARSLGLEPQRIYHVWCPPEELQKPEMLKSVEGIPILLEHHRDTAAAPALDKRIGSTGTDAEWNAPYVDVSLHFTVQKAIDHIEDGSMRELSLSYRYRPVFEAGTTPDGEKYDLIMRDISASHVALVEEGRAGPDVLVADSALKRSKPMTEEVKEAGAPAADGSPEVEKAEVELAQGVKEAAEKIINLHDENEKGEIVDKEDVAVTLDDDRVEKVREALKAKGLDDAAAAEILALLAPEAAEDEDAEPSEDENPAAEALKAAGLDAAPEEVQKAFCAGLEFAAKAAEKGAEDAEPEDACAEDEGEDAPAEDAALKRLEARVMKRLTARLAARQKAAEETRETLGKVRVDAYDSAGAIYADALKREGLPCKGLDAASMRLAYLSFRAGKAKAVRVTANDSAPRKTSAAREAKGQAINTLLNRIHQEH